jgi:hypothetical protein
MLTVSMAKVISIPKAYLTLLAGTLYELDTDQFRKDLRAWEATVQGRTMLRTHDHNSTYTVFGDTYARKVEIINGYSIEFENGVYSVKLTGSNNNIADIQGGILVANNVQVIPTNSAGSIVVSGLASQDVQDIAERVRDVLLSTTEFP